MFGMIYGPNRKASFSLFIERIATFVRVNKVKMICMMKDYLATHHDYWYTLTFSTYKKSRFSKLNDYLTACTRTTDTLHVLMMSSAI